jgi:hypothetical protein
MQITFKMAIIAQPISLEDLNEFQALIGNPLPEDYRQHMLTYNGGIVNEYNNAHLSNPEGGDGIAQFYPIKYSTYTLEDINNDLSNLIPSGYLIIGRTRGGGEIIISLNNDASYGNTKVWFSDETIKYLSTSFTQLINDQVEAIG